MNEMAPLIWQEINLSESKKYTLTQKQKVFVKAALFEFEELYTKNIYDLCKEYARSDKGFLEAIKTSVQNYLKVGKHNRRLGESDSESSGVFRGVVALWYVSKEELNEKEEEALKKASEKLNAVIEFFGEINAAINFFEKVMTRIAIRFQNAIELLSNHQEGIDRLAKFFPRLCLYIFSKISKSIFSEIKSISQKEEYLLECLLKKPILDDLYEIKNTFNESLFLTTESNTQWSIHQMLFRSPIKTSSDIYVYSGQDKKNGFLFFPAQICSQKEVAEIAFYKKLVL